MGYKKFRHPAVKRFPARKADLAVIAECLGLGIVLTTTTSRGQTRRWVAGQITDQRQGAWIRTTHLSEDGQWLWIDGQTVAHLADQAREKLTHRDEILAQMARDHAAAMGRD